MTSSVRHYIAGGVYAKEWAASAVGDTIEQHKHTYDHLSYLAKGSVRVEVEGQPTLQLHGPIAITISAHKTHRIEALTADVLWLCIHPIPTDLRSRSVNIGQLEDTLTEPLPANGTLSSGILKTLSSRK